MKVNYSATALHQEAEALIDLFSVDLPDIWFCNLGFSFFRHQCSQNFAFTLFFFFFYSFSLFFGLLFFFIVCLFLICFCFYFGEINILENTST